MQYIVASGEQEFTLADLLPQCVLHNKPELPFFAKLVCVTLFWPRMEI
jgi:hypothetical protein